MKRIADGFQRQRGDVFGFGDGEETALSLSTMDDQKLLNAPINNLDAERSVGAINYELKIRGAKNLKAASSSHVLGKSLGLIEGKKVGKKFRQMEGKNILPAIVSSWEERQDQLSKEGLSAKEAQNLSVDQRRNADLQKLKLFGGPFCSSQEVKVFLSSVASEEEKVSRLYLEVRYARDSSVSFPKNSDIFRLKKAYRNLDAKTYAENLMIFLDKVSFRNTVEMGDFVAALDRMSSA